MCVFQYFQLHVMLSCKFMIKYSELKFLYKYLRLVIICGKFREKRVKKVPMKYSAYELLFDGHSNNNSMCGQSRDGDARHCIHWRRELLGDAVKINSVSTKRSAHTQEMFLLGIAIFCYFPPLTSWTRETQHDRRWDRLCTEIAVTSMFDTSIQDNTVKRKGWVLKIV